MWNFFLKYNKRDENYNIKKTCTTSVKWHIYPWLEVDVTIKLKREITNTTRKTLIHGKAFFKVFMQMDYF
jgi:hypothetical protein